MLSLIRAQEIGARVVEQLRPFCKRIEIAGSIRRRRPEVGDIDLVIEVADRIGLEKRVKARCKLEKCGAQYLVAVMQDGVQLDLWFSHSPRVVPEGSFFADPETKPDNFGSLLVCRTGSVGHNIALCERAKRLGLNWNPHWGVYQGGVCIGSASEADLYRALGLEFIEPTQREFATRGEQLQLIAAPTTQYSGGKTTMNNTNDSTPTAGTSGSPVRVDTRLLHRIGVREWGLPSLVMPGQIWRSEDHGTVSCMIDNGNPNGVAIQTLPLVVVRVGDPQWMPDTWRAALWEYVQAWPSSGCGYGPFLALTEEQRCDFIRKMAAELVASDNIGCRSIAHGIGEFAAYDYELPENNPVFSPPTT